MRTEDQEFEALARRVDQALQEVERLEEEARRKGRELREALEAFHRFCLVRMVRSLRGDPVGRELLLKLVEDPAVYALFLMHGIVKPDLATRVAQALELIRPYMRSHGGDVELVRVDGETVFLRLHGACSGCSLSAQTLRNGVEEVLRSRVPEVRRIEVVEDQPAAGFIPLEAVLSLEETGWVAGPWLEELSEGAPLGIEIGGKAVLVVLWEGKVYAYRNQCPHMGMPLDRGKITENGVLVCPWHGFRFDVSSGECLTASHVQLEPYPVRIEEGRVWVRPR